MGAKVGNIGGGMVELFSQSWTDHSTTHTFTLTDAQIQEMAEYDFVITTNSAVGSSSNRYYRGTGVAYVPHLIEFLNSAPRYSMYLLTGTRNAETNYNSSDSVSFYFEKDASLNKKYTMYTPRGADSSSTHEVKFYGIKL